MLRTGLSENPRSRICINVRSYTFPTDVALALTKEWTFNRKPTLTLLDERGIGGARRAGSTSNISGARQAMS
ncbi:hypothetical protein PG993_010796 [Apiospora rasikravindrae]|uniref:Uncharacterized protein n=1 Tax=Apiospora rasikravindrae TaxID=990691 RepID=A0ABR1SDN1_9PEZI